MTKLVFVFLTRNAWKYAVNAVILRMKKGKRAENWKLDDKIISLLGHRRNNVNVKLVQKLYVSQTRKKLFSRKIINENMPKESRETETISFWKYLISQEKE